MLVASSQQALFKNQKDLAQVHDELHDQFNVMVRSLITRVNQLGALVNTLMNDDIVEPITEGSVRHEFAMLYDFKKRPDRKQHAQAWCLGLDNLIPPPPPPAEEEEAEDPGPAVEETDEARMFGGDYEQSDLGNGTTEQEGPASSAGDETPPVPEVRDKDAGETQRAG